MSLAPLHRQQSGVPAAVHAGLASPNSARDAAAGDTGANRIEHEPVISTAADGPALGAIVSMWRGSPASGQGHTGFYRGETSTLIWIEGDAHFAPATD
jgi:hypothetical protein